MLRRSAQTDAEYIIQSEQAAAHVAQGFDHELDDMLQGCQACRVGVKAFLCKQRGWADPRRLTEPRGGGAETVFNNLIFIYSSDHFVKTGSGQTKGKLKKTPKIFCRA